MILPDLHDKFTDLFFGKSFWKLFNVTELGIFSNSGLGFDDPILIMTDVGVYLCIQRHPTDALPQNWSVCRSAKNYFNLILFPCIPLHFNFSNSILQNLILKLCTSCKHFFNHWKYHYVVEGNSSKLLFYCLEIYVSYQIKQLWSSRQDASPLGKEYSTSWRNWRINEWIHYTYFILILFTLRTADLLFTRVIVFHKFH